MHGVNLARSPPANALKEEYRRRARGLTPESDANLSFCRIEIQGLPAFLRRPICPLGCKFALTAPGTVEITANSSPMGEANIS
jgi:hypothetical protein